MRVNWQVLFAWTLLFVAVKILWGWHVFGWVVLVFGVLQLLLAAIAAASER